MQNDKGNRLRTTALILVWLLILGSSMAQAKRENHTFTLYPAGSHDDPYILTYPVTVNKVGLIRIFTKVRANRSGQSSTVFAGVRLRNLATGKVVVGKRFPPKRLSIQLRYGVDSPDVRKGGRFRVELFNYSKWFKGSGELLVSYPVAGEGEEDEKKENLVPDLAVEGIRLDASGYVQVTLANRGRSRIAPVFWDRDAPRLMLYRNGRSWGGAGLPALDPERALRVPGGRVVYHSRLRPVPGDRVRAVLDCGPRFRDGIRANNRAEYLVRSAGSPATDSVRPDLAVADLRLTGDCRVAVVLVNRTGAGLPPNAWQQGQAPTLLLYRNGRRWGGADLRVIDPAHTLANQERPVRYVSRLRVGETTAIRAELSVRGVGDEMPENNILVKNLSCGR